MSILHTSIIYSAYIFDWYDCLCISENTLTDHDVPYLVGAVICVMHNTKLSSLMIKIQSTNVHVLCKILKF